MRRLALFVLSLALAAGGCSRTDSGQPVSGGTPNFTLASVDGAMVSLSDSAGKVVIVDFWATWCPPCQEMIPILSKLHRNYSGKGLVVLGVSLDEEGLQVLSPFVAAKGIPYKVLLGDRQVAKSFGGITSIPTLFIVSRDGRLVRKLEGYHDYDRLEEEISKYL